MNDSDVAAIRDLMARISEGDVAAFEQFYLLTVVDVLRITYSVLRNRSHSEEVAQEVYLEVWQNARRFDPDRNIGHLILTMARRRAIDRVRATQAARERDHLFATRDYQPDRDDTSDRGDIRVSFAPVADAIQKLPRTHREVLVLAYVHGYTHSEIAQALDLPLGTVKTRLRDSLNRLRTQLNPTTPT